MIDQVVKDEIAICFCQVDDMIIAGHYFHPILHAIAKVKCYDSATADNMWSF